MEILTVVIIGLVAFTVGLVFALFYAKAVMSKQMTKQMQQKQPQQEEVDALRKYNGEQEITVNQLKSALKNTKVKAENQEKLIIDLEEKLGNIQPDYDKMKEQASKIQSLEQEIEDVKIQYARSEKQEVTELELKEKALQNAQKELEAKTLRVAELENTLTESVAKLELKEKVLQDTQKELETKTSRVTELENQLTEISAKLGKIISPTPIADEKAESEEVEGKEIAAQASSENSKPKPATPKPALAKVIEQPDGEDNLRDISGIGAVIQDKLNQEGIRSFKDLSELNDEKIKELQEKTRIFPSKLKKWMTEAQAILQKREAEKEA